MDISSIAVAVLAVVAAGTIPGIAWMLKSSSSDRYKRIESLADLLAKTQGSDELMRIVAAEIKYEQKRRGARWKWKMFVIYLACALPAGTIVGMLFSVLVPASPDWNIWWFIGPFIGITIVLSARNYVRSGPGLRQEDP